MENEQFNLNKKYKNYNEEKYELFFDYSNSYSFENILKEKNNKAYKLNSENENNYNINRNIYDNNNSNNNFNKSYNEGQSTKINSSFNSYSLNEYIQRKKEEFNKISISMNKIIDKHKNDKNIYNLETNNYNDSPLEYNYDKDKKLNKIVDHLIKAYSKDELKYIKEKINNKVLVDEDEPQPETLLNVYNYNNAKNRNRNKNKNNLKLSSDSPSFLKITNNNKDIENNKTIIDKNKNELFKKINKNINYKPIKINFKNISNKKKPKIIDNTNHNNTHIINKTDISKNTNIKFKPEFYTYIKCKTSFEYIDNFLKRQKSYNNYITNKKTNLKNIKNIADGESNTFIPNISLTSNSKYSIKLDAERLNESKKDKSKRMLYNNALYRNNNKNKLTFNKSFSFTPNINKYKIKKNKIFKASTHIKYFKRKKIDKNEKKELGPIKYINHKFDYVKSIYRNDSDLFKRIKEQNDKKVKKYEKLKTEYDNEKLEACTFKPDMSKTYNKNLSYTKNYNNKKDNNTTIIKNNKNLGNEKENNNFNYVDFYQFKKNIKNKENKLKKENNDNNKYIEKIGSSTPIVISNKLKKNNSMNKKKENKNSFLIMHKLLLDNKP